MIITNRQEFDTFLQKWNAREAFIDVIYANPNIHEAQTVISVIMVKFLDNSDYILPFNHNDCINLNPRWMYRLSKSTTIKFCINAKSILHKLTLKNVVDLNIRKYLMTNTFYSKTEWYTPAHTHFERLDSTVPDINAIVPILKHKEMFDNMISTIKPLVEGEHNEFYNDIAPVVFQWVESAGLKVDPVKFHGDPSNITPDNFVYTQYNMFTSTGRPSNARGGVNYAALNKRDGTRSAFITRFDTGKLIQMDYDAYHIRIIANLIKYSIPERSAHQWLAKQYFDTDDITKEMYDESKSITFNLLYGSAADDVLKKVPFFKEVNKFTTKVWKCGLEHGYVPSPISKKKIYLDNIEDVTEKKLFNYLLQCLETELNIEKMYRIRQLFLSDPDVCRSELVLYTYDSFLFDFFDGDKHLFPEIINIMEDGGKYPVKIETGKVYDALSPYLYEG